MDRAASYGIPGIQVDGKDVTAVYQAAEQAIERAKNGEGPTLIECMTYRNYGHFEGDAQRYKTNQEKTEHQEEKDAITLFKNELLKQQLLTDQEISSIEASVAEAIDEAVRFSEESEYPDHAELLTDVYVSYQ